MPTPTADLTRILARFEAAWPKAIVAFSPFTRLPAPTFCMTVEDEKREGLQGSFAMIRLRDERILISIRQVAERGLESHALAILAHEVGHYVHAPGTLAEHIRLHERIRRTLPVGDEQHAGLVANLYTDLLLNDRLQRSCGIDIAGVYEALKRDDSGPLWCVYVRMYERLWSLRTGTLGPVPTPETDLDAELGARIVRTFRDHWLDGAASFTLLIAPYLEAEKDGPTLPGWLDTAGTTIGDQIPDGLTDDDFDPSKTLHPAIDGRLSDEETDLDHDGEADEPGHGGGRSLKGDGRPDERTVRSPSEYTDLLRRLGASGDPKAWLARYYRELALPHVIPFPSVAYAQATDPLPEGLDAWEPGAPMESIDWMQTMLRSPVVIPGVTTMQRAFGTTQGGEPDRRPPDLYVGIDCSGSMGNPAHQLTYPVVAGVVLTLSALRAGARVMACLSGSWRSTGSHVQTDGFVRDESRLLGVLTDYLGTGASFGLDRLIETFVNGPARRRPVHILVVSDSDLFGEIDGFDNGWALTAEAVRKAGGGATAVLRLAGVRHHQKWLDKLGEAGFDTALVTDQSQLVTFARAFSRKTFTDLET